MSQPRGNDSGTLEDMDARLELLGLRIARLEQQRTELLHERLELLGMDGK